jgi:hypothetical protein
MSTRRAALVLGVVALSGGALGACGGSDTLVDSVPKSTPDLTVPNDSAGLPAVQTTATTATTTDTTATGTTTGAAPVTPTQATPAPQTNAAPSGGTPTPTQTTASNGGGTPAGGFSDFCKQNPGACGQ